MAFSAVITKAGIEEVINAEHTGTAPVKLTRVGLGSGIYTPTEGQTEMVGKFKDLETIAGSDVGDNIIHLTIRDESLDSYTLHEIGIYTEKGTLFAVYSQEEPLLQKVSQVYALISIDFVVSAFDTASITFGDTEFMNPPATTETAGVVELATNKETLAMLDGSKAVTPAALGTLFASFLEQHNTAFSRLPGGVLLQFGRIEGVDSDQHTVVFPVSFDSRIDCAGACAAGQVPATFNVRRTGLSNMILSHNANGKTPGFWYAYGV